MQYIPKNLPLITNSVPLVDWFELLVEQLRTLKQHLHFALIVMSRIILMSALILLLGYQPVFAGSTPLALSSFDTTRAAQPPTGDEHKAEVTRFTVVSSPETDVVAVKSPAATPFTYFLYSAGGQLLNSGTAVPAQGDLQLDLSHYPQGTYFLRVQTIGSTPQLLPVVRQ